MASYTSYLENEINQIVSQQFRKDNYHQSYETMLVDTDDKVLSLDRNSVYILSNPFFDVPETSKIKIFSEDNFLQTSKADFVFLADNNINIFRGYLHVVTSNYGSQFVPYKLILLKITPY